MAAVIIISKSIMWIQQKDTKLISLLALSFSLLCSSHMVDFSSLNTTYSFLTSKPLLSCISQGSIRKTDSVGYIELSIGRYRYLSIYNLLQEIGLHCEGWLSKSQIFRAGHQEEQTGSLCMCSSCSPQVESLLSHRKKPQLCL